MEIILRIFQVFLAIGLIGVVLLQRSEGGGLGVGSSGGMGSFMSVRGTANFMTRVTGILAALFMVTCLTLAVIAKPGQKPQSIFDGQSPTAPVQARVSQAPVPVVPPAADASVPPAPAPATSAPPTAQPEAVVPAAPVQPQSAAPAPANSNVEAPAKTAPAPAPKSSGAKSHKQ